MLNVSCLNSPVGAQQLWFQPYVIIIFMSNYTLPQPSPVPIPALVQSVISCVKLLCERLLFIEPASLSDAVYNLRRACKSVGQQQSGRAVGGKEKADITRAGDTAETDVSALVVVKGF